MTTNAVTSETAVHTCVLRIVRDAGTRPLILLVDDVARETRTTADEANAAVWDLVQEDRLAYGANGQVSFIR